MKRYKVKASLHHGYAHLLDHKTHEVDIL